MRPVIAVMTTICVVAASFPPKQSMAGDVSRDIAIGAGVAVGLGILGAAMSNQQQWQHGHQRQIAVPGPFFGPAPRVYQSGANSKRTKPRDQDDNRQQTAPDTARQDLKPDVLPPRPPVNEDSKPGALPSRPVPV